MNKPIEIIVHHSGGIKADPMFDTSNHTFKIVRDYHISLGWGDIGYHWVIEKSGKICKGRDEEKVGAHTIGMNGKSIGVLVMGNFDSGFPTLEQEDSLKRVYDDILSRHPKLKGKIYPHRKYSNKTCYGKNLSNDWAKELVSEDDSTPNIINNNENMSKIKTALLSNRMKSLYWRTSMMIVAFLLSNVVDNLDIFDEILSPTVITMAGLVLGEITKAINNSLSKE